MPMRLRGIAFVGFLSAPDHRALYEVAVASFRRGFLLIMDSAVPPQPEALLPRRRRTTDSKLKRFLRKSEKRRTWVPPLSSGAYDPNRHASLQDLSIEGLPFNYDIASTDYPLSRFQSPQDLFSAVEYRQHLDIAQNFQADTSVECLSVEGEKQGDS
jgi:hypothetical protein